MDIGVAFVINLAAAQALIAAVGGDAFGEYGLLAVEGFGQCAGEQFEFFQLVAGKEIGVSQTAAGQRPLQELDALGFL